jgi:DNA-binding XRE family transcriptional regulator
VDGKCGIGLVLSGKTSFMPVLQPYVQAIALAVMPLSLKRAIKKLGRDINTARRRRQLTVDMMTQRASISKPTYLRVEKGDPNVAFGTYCMVLFALGEADRIQDLLDISRDETGLLLDEARLPKRVRRKAIVPEAL